VSGRGGAGKSLGGWGGTENNFNLNITKKDGNFPGRPGGSKLVGSAGLFKERKRDVETVKKAVETGKETRDVPRVDHMRLQQKRNGLRGGRESILQDRSRSLSRSKQNGVAGGERAEGGKGNQRRKRDDRKKLTDEAQIILISFFRLQGGKDRSRATTRGRR